MLAKVSFGVGCGCDMLLQEHHAFEDGLKQFGTNWRAVQRMIPSRTLVQIRTHAQKYFLKHGLPASATIPGASPSHGLGDADGVFTEHSEQGA